MKIKRFMAPDMRQAIRRVREELGMDAVILSNRKVAGGVELMAAIDFDAELAAGTPDTPRPIEQRAGEAEAAAGAPPAEAPSAHRPGQDTEEDQEAATVAALQRELASMRDLLETQLARIAWGEFARERPRQAEVVRQLERLGLDQALGRAIAESGPATRDLRQAWRAALAALAERLPVEEHERLDHGGIIALVGPTGVGKTTSLAKLAARYIIRQGRRDVALINTDTQRIGTLAQLNTLGQLLGVPVYQAENTEALTRVLKGLDDKRLILIDTPGLPPRDAALAHQLDALAAIPGLRLALVLAANMARNTLTQTLHRFGRGRGHGTILTKLDEAETLGEAFSALIEANGPPLAYVGTGQRIAEDLEAANRQRLVVRAVELVRRREQDSLTQAGASAASTLIRRSSVHA